MKQLINFRYIIKLYMMLLGITSVGGTYYHIHANIINFIFRQA